MIRS
ncbi:hypothetical protein YPPY06_1797, partial [Yersinia pestis PY-06]|jgi:hypothetical protein